MSISDFDPISPGARVAAVVAPSLPSTLMGSVLVLLLLLTSPPYTVGAFLRSPILRLHFGMVSAFVLSPLNSKVTPNITAWFPQPLLLSLRIMLSPFFLCGLTSLNVYLCNPPFLPLLTALFNSVSVPVAPSMVILSPLPRFRRTPGLHVGDTITQESDFVLHFDGGAFRDLGVGGAGTVLWLHSHGRLQLLSSHCIPLLPCTDAHAEAAGAAHAVLLAAQHLSAHAPNKVIIKGDNRPVINFMSNTGKYRRTDLQQLLEAAQHTLAFSLPRVLWSYTPREFNKCADYLAGIARDYARDARQTSSVLSSSLDPFPFALPPSLAALHSPPAPLTLDMISPSFTFPEVISLPTTHLPLVFQHAKHQPQVLKYLRALVQGSKYLPSLSITYRPTAPDHKGHLYPRPLGTQRLPRAIRTLLFGSSHHEIDLIGSHYHSSSRNSLFPFYKSACRRFRTYDPSFVPI